ncbi:hypothetical protein Poli38472_005074 [Pythium oligandrum]|uniref:Uncharacterized protein n=1 Tax=Pythium oligandrum TaxID=41045 RepID=A0A8K1CGN2_PYTOL|nr:hypothetical protein Poli38472_005074 [Pythium oligandrum]|eukprot:TMW62456.1 hypothetical protein Poli38472_005074 [Pythium oligandrum]
MMLSSVARSAASKALTRATRPSVMATASRAFSGNVEYPRIEGSAADLTKTLTTIGARLSIPTAALYLTKKKLEFVVRGMQTPEELREVQRVMLLCDAKFVYPSEFAISTFLASCLKENSADLALDFVRKAKHMRHYVKNQSFVRLATHYEEQGEVETVEEIVQIMANAGVKASTKMYTFRVAHALRQNKFDEAVAIAKEAAADRQVNSHLILTLLQGLEGEALTAQLPLAQYLVSKGDVYVNEKLSAVLKGN